MRILGIYDGHNANAALIEDGKIINAVEEERFSRKKNHDGRILKGPLDSIKFCIQDAKQVDLVALALDSPTKLSLAAYQSYLNDLIKPSRRLRSEFLKKNNPRMVERYQIAPYLLPSMPGITQQTRIERIKSLLEEVGLQNIPIKFVNHHLAHHASSYYTSGKERGISFSLDGRGDDLSGMVCECKNGKLNVLSRINWLESIGHFYSAITVALGFRAVRHEGKIAGLAAFGNPKEELIKSFNEFFTIDNNGKIVSKLADGLAIGPYPDANFSWYVKKIKNLIKGQSREDVAHCAQEVLERTVTQWINFWVKKTKNKNIFLSGGVFSNVRLNQEIMMLNSVKFVYIHPGMTDTGLGVGAALQTYHDFREVAKNPFRAEQLQHIYIGPKYSIDKNIFKHPSIEYDEPIELAKKVSSLIHQNKIIAVYQGRLEYGPRALGNRSVLFAAVDRSTNVWLNKQLGRTEFMPFAPVTLYENAIDCYKIPMGKDPLYTSKFMTITLDCTEKMKKQCPAVVHIDGTARPQLITEDNNPFYYQILKAYYKTSGIPSLVNTSFNMHEEPIVRTPEDAVNSFLRSNLDYLCIGPYLLENKHKQGLINH